MFLIELIVFTLFWAILIFASYWLTFARVRKMPDENGEFLTEKTYLFSDDGLKEISVNSESFTKWTGFKSIEDNKKYIFFFVDKMAAYIIPKRVFKDSNEMTIFLDYVNTRKIK